MNNQLSESTIRKFLEKVNDETETHNITWHRTETLGTPYAFLEGELCITVYSGSNTFTLDMPDNFTQTYVVNEDETKSTFSQLCKSIAKTGQLKSNQFILDYIRDPKTMEKVNKINKKENIRED